MKLPPSISHGSGCVRKLKKTSYGSKQVPCAWFEKFSIVISFLGLVASYDSTLFVEHIDLSRIIFSLYVDNMVITVDDVDGISTLNVELVK